MVSDRNTETARQKHREEECDLKPIETEIVELERDGGERQDQCPDEKGTRFPINALERHAREQSD